MVPRSVQTASGIEFGAQARKIPQKGDRLPLLGHHFGSQNWSKIDPEAIKNRKLIDAETAFEFDTVFLFIFDQILINFDAKMDQAMNEILTQVETCEMCKNVKKLIGFY